MSPIVPRAVVHGRFQPPHNGHLRYFLLALEKAKHVSIGICTPEICTEEYSKQTGYPCTLALNPYSYDDRVTMISAALADEGINPERFSFLPFPSDYKNIDTLVSKDTVFFMSTTDAADENKIQHLSTLGYIVQVIMNVDSERREEKAGDVRRAIPGWEQQVPQAVVNFITHRARQ